MAGELTPRKQLTLMFVSNTASKVEKLAKITKEIPEEMVTEILLRLPANSLLRFKSVSKGWCALIRCPKFIDTHFKHPSQEMRLADYMIFRRSPPGGNTVLLFYSFDENRGLVPKPTPSGFPDFQHNWLMMCGNCNGIICIAGGAPGYAAEATTYLCNPATRESRILPTSPFGGSGWERIACGFGFDPVKRDFKVVSIRCHRPRPPTGKKLLEIEGNLQCEIYDLSSNSWRKVEIQWPDVLVKEGTKNQGVSVVFAWRENSLYSNGCIHWIYQRYGYPKFILCFDIINEVMRQIPIPEYQVPENMTQLQEDLIEVDNSLAIAALGTPEEEFTRSFKGLKTNWMFIWCVEDYGGANERWVKRFSLGPFTTMLRCPITCWNNNALLFVTAGDCLASYSLKEEGSELRILGPFDTMYLLMDPFIIQKESLLSLK